MPKSILTSVEAVAQRLAGDKFPQVELLARQDWNRGTPWNRALADALEAFKLDGAVK